MAKSCDLEHVEDEFTDGNGQSCRGTSSSCCC